MSMPCAAGAVSGGGSGILKVEGQLDGDYGSLSLDALQPHASIEQCGQPPRDGQAQPGAAVRARGRGVPLSERIEHALLVPEWDPRTKRSLKSAGRGESKYANSTRPRRASTIGGSSRAIMKKDGTRPKRVVIRRRTPSSWSPGATAKGVPEAKSITLGGEDCRGTAFGYNCETCKKGPSESPVLGALRASRPAGRSSSGSAACPSRGLRSAGGGPSRFRCYRPGRSRRLARPPGRRAPGAWRRVRSGW